MPSTAVSPGAELEAAFLAMVADFERNDPGNAGFYAPAKEGFAAYVQGLLDEERGVNVRDGWVPCTHRWLVSPGGDVVGATRLRHNIATPFLATNAGHIGYDVAPSHRGRGHGHLALRVALAEAARMGMARVLLFAAADNAASRAVIERQGGELEAIAFSEHWQEQLCKYWIDVPGAA